MAHQLSDAAARSGANQWVSSASMAVAAVEVGIAGQMANLVNASGELLGGSSSSENKDGERREELHCRVELLELQWGAAGLVNQLVALYTPLVHRILNYRPQ